MSLPWLGVFKYLYQCHCLRWGYLNQKWFNPIQCDTHTYRHSLLYFLLFSFLQLPPSSIQSNLIYLICLVNVRWMSNLNLSLTLHSWAGPVFLDLRTKVKHRVSYIRPSQTTFIWLKRIAEIDVNFHIFGEETVCNVRYSSARDWELGSKKLTDSMRGPFADLLSFNVI